MRLLICTLLMLCVAVTAFAADEIDWRRAQTLRQKSKAGQKLTQEEQAYLEKATAARGQRQRKAGGDAADAPAGGKASTGLKPLTDMAPGDKYKEQTGGLYGEGRNTPPEALLKRAMDAAAKVQPLDAAGKPAEDGKIVLLSVGMSNTTQVFSAFQSIAKADAAKNPRLIMVDGAQGGQDASDWVNPAKRVRQDRPDVWQTVEQRLQKAGVTPQQVQVVWMKQARRNPADIGEFPRHADALKQDMAATIAVCKQRFPNLRLMYVSSRTYAGYAESPLNPEPYAYESAFAVRGLIEDAMKSAAPGAPVVLWGPYLWSDGTAGRKLDDLKYTREDYANDGTHPSPSGQAKVAQQLLHFFTTDPTAKPWFTHTNGAAIDEEHAIKLATKILLEKDPKAQNWEASVVKRADHGGWFISFDAVPARLGGVLLIELSATGDLLRYVRGR